MPTIQSKSSIPLNPAEFSPLIVSLTRKRVSRHNILPPLSSGEQRKSHRPVGHRHHHHHHHSKDSSSRKGVSVSAVSSRFHHHHHHPPSTGKRSHSASHESTPVESVHATPKKLAADASSPSRHGRAAKTVCTNDRRSGGARGTRVITTESTTHVRVLRARPAFYPMVRDRYASSSPIHRTRSRTAQAAAASILAMDGPPPPSQQPQLYLETASTPPITDLSGKRMTLEARKRRRGGSSKSTNSVAGGIA